MKLDIEGIAGNWLNTHARSRGIRRIDVAAGEAGPFARVLGAGPDALVDWGASDELAMYGGATYGQVDTAFTARRDLGFAEALLCGNVNRGVLVLACFCRYREGRGRAPFFSREFYYRQPAPPPGAAPAVVAPPAVDGVRIGKLDDLDAGTAAELMALHARFPAGRWRNTKLASPEITDLRTNRRDQALRIAIRSAAPDGGALDWGEAELEPFACVDEDGARNLVYRIQHVVAGVMEVTGELRMNKGLLVLATFTRFKDNRVDGAGLAPAESVAGGFGNPPRVPKDGGSPPRFTREFFHAAG